MTTLLRKWKEIQEVECIPTQIALATCAHPDVLIRLKEAFPECFRYGGDSEVDKIAWSVLRKKAEAAIEEDYAGWREDPDDSRIIPDHTCAHSYWLEAAKELHLPHVHWESWQEVPQEVKEELDTHIPDDGLPLVITYERAEWCVAYLEMPGYELLKPGQRLIGDPRHHEHPCEVGLVLWAAVNFDF